jgi:hypothetical protein
MTAGTDRIMCEGAGETKMTKTTKTVKGIKRKSTVRSFEMKRNKTRIMAILAALLAFTTVAGLFAQTEADFEVAFTEDGKGVVIKKYTGKVTNTIKIPAAIEGLPVREIGEEAFIGAGTVSNSLGIMKADVPFAVVLPQGLIKIGDNAFAESAITSVVIPDSVTEIGDLAFANYEFYTRTGSIKPPNPLLTSVTLPKGLKKAGRGAFKGNSALKTVVIPEGCSVLGEEMFEECTALTAVTIPKSITSIPSDAFARCTGLKTLVLPDGLTEIAGRNSGGGAFFACTALTSVTLPSTITTIGKTAFRACSALTTVTIPDSVQRIDGGNDFYGEKTLLEWAFPECGKLNLVTQARLKKITVFSQEREEREAREQAERIERAAQAKREQEEREAQKKREQEEGEAQAKLLEEEAKRAQAAHTAELEKRQRANETARALITRLTPIYSVAGRRDKPTKQQFNEFITIYQDYIAAKDNYHSLKENGGFYDIDLDFSYETLENYVRMIISALDINQQKQFVAKFGVR